LPAVIQTFCHYEIADVFMHLTDFIGFYIGYNINYLSEYQSPI